MPYEERPFDKMTEREIKVYVFVEEYGPCVDFGGKGSSRADRKAVEALIARGILAGDYRNTRIASPPHIN